MSESMKERSRAHLIANALSGSWRSSIAPLQISDAELTEVTELLIQGGAGALVWRRICDSTLATSEAAGQLRQAYRLHRLEAVVHLRKIKQILERMRAAGIEPVLVKGWSVARLYAEPGLRHFIDVDLCVARRDYARAQQLLAGLGDEGLYVDLHEGLDHLDTIAWDDFFARTQLLRVDETEIRVPCAEDHLRILCIHWLRHGAWKPAGLCDIAALVESRSADFDWQRCLGVDPVRAGWVACTISLAQELLGANVDAKLGAGSADILSALSAQRELPCWLVPAVLRQWSRSLSPNNRYEALPSLLSNITNWRAFIGEAYSRLDQPIRATIALHGRFNNYPRWPYQLGELLLHSPEVPKQLASLLYEKLKEVRRSLSSPRTSDLSLALSAKTWQQKH